VSGPRDGGPQGSEGTGAIHRHRPRVVGPFNRKEEAAANLWRKGSPVQRYVG
jgi:hypothetical protein